MNSQNISIAARALAIGMVAALVLLMAGAVALAYSFPTSGTGGSFSIKGIEYVSWWHGQYSSINSDISLDNLKNTNANNVGLVVTWYMNNRTSNTISNDTDKTPTDLDIVHAIGDIHSRGMGVMLKPHVDIKDGSWRGGISPSNTTAWFESYNNFITHYAQIAQSNSVEYFSVGTELKSLSGSAYGSNWNTIINNIKTIYTGNLTYAANWDEYTNVAFWNMLDYGGVDAYFPLSDAQNPSIQELMNGWSDYSGTYGIHNWVAEIESWQSAINKPIIFTEIGYRSIDYAAREPWSWSTGGTYNGQLQANCYEAAIQVFKGKTWFSGMYWWDWRTNPNAGGVNDINYTPQNKPAEATLTALYGGTYPVHNINKGTDYAFIQTAIEYASPGDEIHVDSGTYYENVNITKRLILRGVDTGGGMPVVDAGGFGNAIILSADGIMLEGFTATKSNNPTYAGIKLVSNNNILTGNNASNNNYGIRLYNSNNNTLNGNNASNNYDGIHLEYSNNNTLNGNNASSNNQYAILLASSTNNMLSSNYGSNNIYGIYLYYSNGNTLFRNNFSNKYNAITMYYSNNNKLNGNNASNTNDGIDLANSNNNTLSYNNVSHNFMGIYLVNSNNNRIYHNNILNNTNPGIYLRNSSNNIIYNNYFNNTNNFYFSGSKYNNTWNTKKRPGTNIIGGPYLGGNFWANPSGTGFSQTCKDVNKDGICDLTYILDSSNTDYLPLAHTPGFGAIIAGTGMILALAFRRR